MCGCARARVLCRRKSVACVAEEHELRRPGRPLRRLAHVPEAAGHRRRARLQAGGDGGAARRPRGIPEEACGDRPGSMARGTTSGLPPPARRDERARLRSPRPPAVGEKSRLLRDGGGRRERSARARGSLRVGDGRALGMEVSALRGPGRRAGASSVTHPGSAEASPR